MRWYHGLCLDLLVVAIFSVVAHILLPTSLDAVGLWSIFWPFALGLGVAWTLLRTVMRRFNQIAKGAVVWGDTVAIGVLVRAFLTPSALSWSFLATSAGILALGLVGWRVILDVVDRRKESTSA